MPTRPEKILKIIYRNKLKNIWKHDVYNFIFALGRDHRPNNWARRSIDLVVLKQPTPKSTYRSIIAIMEIVGPKYGKCLLQELSLQDLMQMQQKNHKVFFKSIKKVVLRTENIINDLTYGMEGPARIALRTGIKEVSTLEEWKKLNE